jgi:S-adenosylmethionine:tRNA-ribosyltransferase-isomerase (queuine synthetase)
MKPTVWPRDDAPVQRLLHVDVEHDRFADERLGDLPKLLSPGDVFVLNDAATLPASLWLADGSAEVRLLGRASQDNHFNALLFGASCLIL